MYQKNDILNIFNRLTTALALNELLYCEYSCTILVVKIPCNWHKCCKKRKTVRFTRYQLSSIVTIFSGTTSEIVICFIHTCSKKFFLLEISQLFRFVLISKEPLFRHMKTSILYKGYIAYKTDEKQICLFYINVELFKHWSKVCLSFLTFNIRIHT